MMMEKINQDIEDSAATKGTVHDLAPSIEKAAKAIVDSLSKGGKLLIAGNGGSASQASHMAGEFVGRYLKERRGLPAIALATDASILTAWSNDYAFETVFSRQVEALGKEGDVFLGITTSGNSPNIINAVKEAKSKGMKTVALLGKDGGRTKGLADVELIVTQGKTPRIQETHLLIIHIICELVEEALA